jgi:DNA-binding NarL/FixJ family response regulator
MTRILIADDHAVVRAGLKQLLAREFPGAEFHQAETVPETLEALQRWCFDFLMLDLFMPGGSGFDVLHQIRQTHPRVPVLVLSTAPDDPLGLRTLRAGASGYVNKQSALELIVLAIRKVMAGGKYISAALAEHLAADAERPLHDNLSEREYQVLQLIVAGRPLKEIAGSLFLSVKTIRTFRARILQKLRLQGDVDLVHYVREHLLVEERPMIGVPPAVSAKDYKLADLSPIVRLRPV